MNSLSELKKKSKDNLCGIIRELQFALQQKADKPKDWFIKQLHTTAGCLVITIPKDFTKNNNFSRGKYYKIYIEEIK